MKRLLLVLALILPTSGSGQWVAPTPPGPNCLPCWEVSDLVSIAGTCTATLVGQCTIQPGAGTSFALISCDGGSVELFGSYTIADPSGACDKDEPDRPPRVQGTADIQSCKAAMSLAMETDLGFTCT